MKLSEQRRALRIAVQAARAAGAIMARNFHLPKKITSSSQHDIKLELDERCQRRIESLLTAAFPEISILGEEGVVGDPESECRWVVDPIDGTVNFTYGIPHACVSIALQRRATASARTEPAPAAYQTLVGVVYDPFCDEIFTAIRGQSACVNGRAIRVSDRDRLEEAIVSIGFSKTRQRLKEMIPAFGRLTHRVRKIRVMGAAALSLAYVASGRMDAYVERGLRLWDIAAGGLLVECAGGDFLHWLVPGEAHTYGILVNNGRLRKPLQRLAWGQDGS